MKPIPSDILAQFEAVLKKRRVPAARHADYRKWLHTISISAVNMLCLNPDLNMSVNSSKN
jgi:hypothetical protein